MAFVNRTDHAARAELAGSNGSFAMKWTPHQSSTVGAHSLVSRALLCYRYRLVARDNRALLALNNLSRPDTMETENNPELNGLLQDGIDNLEVLSDKRLREYAVWSLKEQGATSHSSLSELLAMAEVHSVHTREQNKESMAGEATAGLANLFVDLAEGLERELRIRALPN